MTTRRIPWALMAVRVSMVALTPLRGAAPPGDQELNPLPVFAVVLPTGVCIGTLKIVACALDETGHLRLTGLLSGKAPGHQQPITTLATLCDPGRTTDVLRLAIAPIVPDPMGIEIGLARHRCSPWRGRLGGTASSDALRAHRRRCPAPMCGRTLADC
jgi:hypothetical protein